MGIFDSIKSFFSKETSEPGRGDKEPSITSFNSNGDQILTSRSVWRTDVLPKQIEKAWNDPETLYSVLIMAIRDNFFEDVIVAAEHLMDIDPVKHRCYNLLGIVYLKTNNLAKAEQTLEKGIGISDYKAALTTNLAKVYAAQGQEQKAINTLWQALQLDPNQDNALDWFASIELEKDPEFGHMTAYGKVAQIPGSWRAQIFIARFYLESKEFNTAKNLYEDVLKNVGDEPDALMSISGDLAKNKRFEDIFYLIFPIFNIDKHGPYTAMNLINVCIEIRNKDEGVRIAKDLRNYIHTFNRFDLLNTLNILEKKLEEL